MRKTEAIKWKKSNPGIKATVMICLGQQMYFYEFVIIIAN